MAGEAPISRADVSHQGHTRVQITDRIQPLLGDLIRSATSVFVASAYLGAGAVDRLLTAGLASPRCPRLEFLVGIDPNTSAEALVRLRMAQTEYPAQVSVRCVPHRSGSLFHPKAYWLRCGRRVHLIIGSGNLSDAAQDGNHELFCHIEANEDSDVAADFARLREHWQAVPFSQELCDATVAAVRRYAADFQSLVRRSREIAALQSRLEEHHRNWWQLVEASAGNGTPIVARNGSLPGSEPTPTEADPFQAARDVLAAGFLFTVRLSLASLQVPITGELVESQAVPEGEVVVLDKSTAAYVRLLPAEAYGEFEQLRRDVERELSTLALSLPAGWFVPPAAQPLFERALRRLRERHRRLVAKYVRRVAPMREHLGRTLDEEIERAWAANHPDGPELPANVHGAIRSRIAERREELRREPDRAVPLIISPALHPAVTRQYTPGHPAWRLEPRDPDDALVTALLDLLDAQSALISEVVRLQQQPARRRAYERASRLIALPGKTTRTLLRRLSPWTRPGPLRLSASQRLRRAEQQRKALGGALDAVTRHAAWLRELRSEPPDSALQKLAADYEITGVEAG